MRGALLALAFALAPCTRTTGLSSDGAPSGDRRAITVKGSDTMVVLGQRWAEEYMKADPSVTVEVAGGGSGTGVAALINGTADICESSRPMTDVERRELADKRGTPAVETRVAKDALAVYVSERSPVREVSIQALARVYRGELTTWDRLGGPHRAIVLYGRENNSGTYAFFKEHVLGGDDFAASVQSLAGTSAVASAVKGDELGIGYGGIAYLEGVRALAVKADEGSPAVAPSLATAEDGTYPLSRYLYFYTAGQPGAAVARFVAWVIGAVGQKTVADVGYYPLPKKKI